MDIDKEGDRLDWLYEWIKNIAFYMIIVSVVLNVLPGNRYQKYIQFFSGIVLILLAFLPIVRLTGKEQTIKELYEGYSYKQKKEEFEQMEKYFTDTDILEFLPEEYLQDEEGQEEKQQENERVKIDSIVIGEE